MKRLSLFLAALAMLLGSSVHAYASTILTTPAGLAPGSEFRFVFVTDGTMPAVSTSISTYNTFVNNQAAGYSYNGLSLDNTWSVIGSTSTESAISNIGTYNVPVYLSNGTLVSPSDGISGLFSGSLDYRIDTDLSGDTLPSGVWTGTADNGNGLPGFTLGSYGVVYGEASHANNAWVRAGIASPAGSASLPFYGISAELTVPGVATTPEPSTLTLLGIGIAGMAGYGWRRRKLAAA